MAKQNGAITFEQDVALFRLHPEAFANYKDQYVAIKNGEVAASNTSCEVLMAELGDTGGYLIRFNP